VERNDFQRLVVEKLIEIERRITNIEGRLCRIEKDWQLVRRIFFAILAAIAAKLGIDVSGILK